MCTTINALTQPIEIVANASDWCLVVVGDAITPGDAYQRLARQKPDKVAYLSLEDQRRLPYETSAAMPERHFGRKNVGYVYAAHAGASQIFDFDDDNALLSATAMDGLKPSTKVQLASGQGPVNPYPWFGASKAWPRGLPLDSLEFRERVDCHDQIHGTTGGGPGPRAARPRRGRHLSIGAAKCFALAVLF